VEEQSSEQLFRQKALKKAFAPDELDKMMQVTKPTGWLALMVIGVIIFGALIWGALGLITVKIAAEGIIIDGDRIGQQKAVLFLHLDDKDRIKPNMTVHISPAGFPPLEYGYMVGTVRDITMSPLTNAKLTDVLKNEALVSLFSSGGPYVMATVELQTSPQKPGGYEWTSSQGPANPISSDTLCQAYIITDEKHPISLLLPAKSD
jgi:hypothetical protein